MNKTKQIDNVFVYLQFLCTFCFLITTVKIGLDVVECFHGQKLSTIEKFQPYRQGSLGKITKRL